MTQSPHLTRDTCAALVAFHNDETGATAIEYALLASLIAVAIIAAVTGLGGSVSSMYNDTTNAIQ